VWTRDKAARELAAYETATFEKPGDELVLLAESLDADEIIGEVGLVWLLDLPDVAEVGYVYNPKFGGRGLAAEAVKAFVDTALSCLGFAQVIARTDAANLSSRTLCERVGMQRLSTSRGDDGRNVAECTYGITRAARSWSC
jgi:RimJ/RimL family protein N-acetyltransferase